MGLGKRYLEASNCVGLCVNMCKIPTQDFFANSLGVPVTMTPSKFISQPNRLSEAHTGED